MAKVRATDLGDGRRAYFVIFAASGVAGAAGYARLCAKECSVYLFIGSAGIYAVRDIFFVWYRKASSSLVTECSTSI